MSEWTYLSKRHNRRTRTAWTGAQVRAFFEGLIQVPTALVDALGRPDRVHLFTNGASELWICPAENDDQSAYSLAAIGTGSRRQVMVSGLYDRIGFTEAVNPIYGDWTVEDDRVIVRFSVAQEVAS